MITKILSIHSHFTAEMNEQCRRNMVVLTTIKTITIPNGMFSKKGLYIFHLNISSLLPKVNGNRLNVKQAKVSIIGIRGPKLDSSILNF